jgi:predicted HTH domain antitoxin
MKKERMAGTRLPKELLRDLETIERTEQADRSTTIRKLLSRAIGEWKLEYYAKQYAERKMTLARAAKEADVSVWEMMDYLRQKKIASQYDMEEFQKDLETIYRRTGPAAKVRTQG